MGDRVCAGIYPLVSFREMYSTLHHKQEKVISLPKITPTLYTKHKDFFSTGLQTCVFLLTTNFHF